MLGWAWNFVRLNWTLLHFVFSVGLGLCFGAVIGLAFGEHALICAFVFDKISINRDIPSI